MALLLLAGSGVAGVPQRVVSLDLCSDWILGEHADKGQVAGLSAMGQRFDARYGPASGWPSHDGSLEQVVALQPDLVLVGPYNASALRQSLQALGLLGGDPSRAHPVLPMPALAADAPRLLVLGANGVGTGLQTFENEVIARAGWRNYLALPGYVRLDMEALVADPPDAILWAAPTSPAKANAFAGHRALLAVVPPPRWLKTDNWRWECPGPWTWSLVEQLQQWRNR